MAPHPTKYLYGKQLLLIFGLLFAVAERAIAQEQAQEVEPLNAGRPDQTQGTNIIPKGLLQIESGLLLEKSTAEEEASRFYTYPEVLLRIGLLKGVELRLQSALQDSAATTDGHRRQVRGIGPLEIGTRVHLWNGNGLLPEAAVQASVLLPLWHNGLEPEHPEPLLVLAFSHELTEQLELQYNLGYGRSGGEAVKSYTLNLSTSITDRVSTFLEVFGEKQVGAPAEHQLDAGFTYLLLPNLQLDIAAGTQLTAPAPDYFITTGITLRLPH